MLHKLWEKIGEGLTERWLTSSYGPSLVFWAGGILAYGVENAKQKFNLAQLPEVTQIAILVIIMFFIGFTAKLVEHLQIEIIRLSEGYLPSFLISLQVRWSKYWKRKIKDKNKQLSELVEKELLQKEPLDEHEKIRKCRMDEDIARLPKEDRNVMPTLLGNLLSAAEEYPEVRYGLNSIVCWPRLYHLLPEVLRHSINMERNRLNESACLLAWSVLFLVWVIWKWWALLSLMIAWIAYRKMVTAAAIYGDLIRSAFDLCRFDLYKALSWPLPNSPENEEKYGKGLTIFLFRGVAPEDFKYR